MCLPLNQGILGVFEDLTSSLCSELLRYLTFAFFHNVCEAYVSGQRWGSVILHTYIRCVLLCS